MSRATTAFAIASLALLTGCSAGGGPVMPSASLPSMDAVAEVPTGPTTVYSRIAAGAVSCWFGPKGRLDRSFVWHGKADPEAKGSRAEVAVHERIEDNKRGTKVFWVTITPKGEGATVLVENAKLPDPMARRMADEAHHWARGGQGCDHDGLPPTGSGAGPATRPAGGAPSAQPPAPRRAPPPGPPTQQRPG
jgi:hypothetical protein